jgi:hypothetical protein
MKTNCNDAFRHSNKDFSKLMPSYNLGKTTLLSVNHDGIFDYITYTPDAAIRGFLPTIRRFPKDF